MGAEALGAKAGRGDAATFGVAARGATRGAASASTATEAGATSTGGGTRGGSSVTVGSRASADGRGMGAGPRPPLPFCANRSTAIEATANATSHSALRRLLGAPPSSAPSADSGLALPWSVGAGKVVRWMARSISVAAV